MEKLIPNSDWCYVCGDQNPMGHQVVFKTDGETVRTRCMPSEHRQGYPGVIHGGALFTLLDEAMGWAASLGHDRLFVTAEMTVRYVKPFPTGTEMVVEGRATTVHRRFTEVAGEVRDDAGNVYATATGKFFPMSAEATEKVAGMLKYGEKTIGIFGR